VWEGGWGYCAGGCLETAAHVFFFGVCQTFAIIDAMFSLGAFDPIPSSSSAGPHSPECEVAGVSSVRSPGPSLAIFLTAPLSLCLCSRAGWRFPTRRLRSLAPGLCSSCASINVAVPLAVFQSGVVLPLIVRPRSLLVLSQNLGPPRLLQMTRPMLRPAWGTCQSRCRYNPGLHSSDSGTGNALS
jgi:hypothetical protein